MEMNPFDTFGSTFGGEETSTTPTADDLDRVRPRLLGLAADLATGGDRSKAVPPDRIADALDRIAGLANDLAAQRRGEAKSR